MHGRVKVKTTAEQQEAKQKERAKNMQLYLAGQQAAREKVGYKGFMSKGSQPKLAEQMNSQYQCTNYVKFRRDKGEFDSEALKVTEHLLLANPDLYTVWNFRKEILLKLKENEELKVQAIMEAELPFVENCLRANPKSYGAWHHRIWTLLQMPDPNWNCELRLCNKYLELDERNFHCWDYRRFVVALATVGPEQELQFTNAKIAANFSNYSSWHYRSKLLPLVFPDAHNGVRPICEEKLLQEFELVQSAAFTDPNDQSAWFYHRWLLGRGDRHVQLNFLHVNREGDVILVFSKPVQLDHARTFVHLSVNQVPVLVNLSSPCDCSDASHVVLGAIMNNITLKTEEPVEVTVAYRLSESVSELTVRLPKCDFEGSTENVGRTKEFCMELSAATSTVLAMEIESCVQLQELEPDCKWPLLTTVLLMRSLDYTKYSDKIAEYFASLIRVDPLRTGYYKNLRSKFIMENCLEGLEARTVHLRLAGRGLDCLYHMEYLVHLKKLDLSSNHLTNLGGYTCYLVSLETLVLDDNLLSDCDGLTNIPKLQVLTIRNNNISKVTSLEGLVKCEALTSLAIEGNPVDDASNQSRKLIADLLPSLQLLDNLRLPIDSERAHCKSVNSSRPTDTEMLSLV